MQVTDRPSPDAPSLTQAIIVQMDYSFEIAAVRSTQAPVTPYIHATIIIKIGPKTNTAEIVHQNLS